MNWDIKYIYFKYPRRLSVGFALAACSYALLGRALESHRTSVFYWIAPLKKSLGKWWHTSGTGTFWVVVEMAHLEIKMSPGSKFDHFLTYFSSITCSKLSASSGPSFNEIIFLLSLKAESCKLLLVFLKRFYDEQLAHASYLVGCYATGEAIVIDPNRNIQQYVQAAGDEAMRIVAVTETHIHADFLSGSRELAQTTGATLYLSDEGDSEWKYQYAKSPNIRLVNHGDMIKIGNIKLDIWHTPGHTPEHISLVITDGAESDEPLGAFTGDFIFVGDVGRPDLLDRVAGFKDTMEKGARVLYQSLQKFIKAMPDHLMLFPAHGAGSACGKALGGVPMSVLGYQKKVNWALRCASEQEFVDGVLTGQPEPPFYFKEMKRMNKMGPAILGPLRTPPKLSSTILKNSTSFLIDIRAAAALRLGFYPGSIGVASCRLCRSFWALTGWHAPYDRDIVLIANTEEDVIAATRSMESIGLDRVTGWVSFDSIPADQIEPINLISVEDAMGRGALGEVNILDVRGRSEYEEGHIPGVTWIPFGYLEGRLSEVPKDKPLVIHCAGGNRSPIAYTVLRKHGLQNLFEMNAGYKGYAATGGEVQTGVSESLVGT